MKRVAAIDIGTNSVRLLIVDIAKDGLQTVAKDIAITRLGQGTSQTGQLSDPAMERTLVAIERFAQQAQRLQSTDIWLVATSAVRDAINREQFAQKCFALTGLVVEVVSGKQEALYSFRGAVSGLATDSPCIVVDIGGGSTELIAGFGNEVKQAISLQVGAVRLTEMFVPDGDFTPNNLREIASYVHRAIEPHAAAFSTPGHLIGVGGTFTTLAAMQMKLGEYSAELVHGYRLSREGICQQMNHLLSLSVEARKSLPGLQPERADIIPAGIGIALSLLQVLGYEEITVSESDILAGIICSRC